MLVLNVPATVGLIVLATPIVRVIFERRAFLPSDTAATAAALQFYAVGLVGYSIVRIASPAFYALGDSRTPVTISIATVIVNATPEPRARARARLPRPRARDVDRGALQRRRAALGAAPAARRAGTPAGAFVRILVASIVMGAAAWAVDRALAEMVPGRRSSPRRRACSSRLPPRWRCWRSRHTSWTFASFARTARSCKTRRRASAPRQQHRDSCRVVRD